MFGDGAAPPVRNAMTDCVRAALSQFERRLEIDGLQRVYLDDVLSEDERMLRIEAIADPNTQTPEFKSFLVNVEKV